MRILLMLVVVMLLGGFFFIISDQNIKLGDGNGFSNAGKLYFLWTGKLLINMKTISANAIKIDWMPVNLSSQNKTQKK